MRDIEQVIATLKRAHPALLVEQLQVAHPGADDDGIWYFNHPEGLEQVTLESSSGNCPFLVEHGDDEREHLATVSEAVSMVAKLLGLVGNAT